MKSSIHWIDSEAKIMFVESVGLWKSHDLLESIELTLSKTPQYLIWNPSNIMFPKSYLRSYEDSDSNRKLALDLMVESLLDRTLKLLIIIQTTDLIIFDAIHLTYSQAGARHLLKFAKSFDEATEIIEATLVGHHGASK
ncbi:MAG: hypothetical protein Phog2KO_30650 [Phototrophicaceae bacterium]